MLSDWNRSYQETYENHWYKEGRHVHYILQCQKAIMPRNICLETDVVGLGTTLLQVKYNRSSEYDDVPDNAMLWPITFASMNLSSNE